MHAFFHRKFVRIREFINWFNLQTFRCDGCDGRHFNHHSTNDHPCQPSVSLDHCSSKVPVPSLVLIYLWTVVKVLE